MKRIPRIVTTQAILWKVYPELWQLKHFYETYTKNCDNSSNLMKRISRIVTTQVILWNVYQELWQHKQFYVRCTKDCDNSSNFMKGISRIVTTQANLWKICPQFYLHRAFLLYCSTRPVTLWCGYRSLLGYDWVTEWRMTHKILGTRLGLH